MLSDVGSGVWRVFQTSNLFFLLKKVEFTPWPDIMLSQTLIQTLRRNVPFDSDFRQ